MIDLLAVIGVILSGNRTSNFLQLPGDYCLVRQRQGCTVVYPQAPNGTYNIAEFVSSKGLYLGPEGDTIGEIYLYYSRDGYSFLRGRRLPWCVEVSCAGDYRCHAFANVWSARAFTEQLCWALLGKCVSRVTCGGFSPFRALTGYYSAHLRGRSTPWELANDVVWPRSAAPGQSGCSGVSLHVWGCIF